MSEPNEDDFVEVWAAPEDASDTARALLDAAEKAGHPVTVVESLGGGGFRVPKDLAGKAKLPKAADVQTGDDDGEEKASRARSPRPRHADDSSK